MLAQSSKVRYIHEPFNIAMSKTKNYNSPLNYWFEYLSNSPAEHQKNVKTYIQSYYTVINMNNLRSLFKIKTAKRTLHIHG